MNSLRAARKTEAVAAHPEVALLQAEEVQELFLDAGAVHSVLSVQKLHDTAARAAHRAVVPVQQHLSLDTGMPWSVQKPPARTTLSGAYLPGPSSWTSPATLSTARLPLPSQKLTASALAAAGELSSESNHRRSAPDGEVFHSLDETPLNVPSAGRLDGGIDQPLATSHGVEEELLGCQPSQIRVLDKPAGLRPEIVLREVRKGSPGETERDPLALHVLLPHASNHLQPHEIWYSS